MVNITWLDPTDQTMVKVERENGDLILRVGDFVGYAGRPDGIRIESFNSKQSDPRGPVGMTYLPWRQVEARWGTPRFTIRGNDHYIICYPVGMPHYGTHIDWTTVHHLPIPIQMVSTDETRVNEK
jgi:hypothetical protein